MENPNNILKLISNKSITEALHYDNPNYNFTFYHYVKSNDPSWSASLPNKSNNGNSDVRKSITYEEIPMDCMMLIFSFCPYYHYIKKNEKHKIINEITKNIPNNYHHLINEKYISRCVLFSIKSHDFIFLNNNIKNKYSTHFITAYDHPPELQNIIHHIIETKKLPCMVFDTELEVLEEEDTDKKNIIFKTIYKDYTMKIFIIDKRENYVTKKAIKTNDNHNITHNNKN